MAVGYIDMTSQANVWRWLFDKEYRQERKEQKAAQKSYEENRDAFPSQFELYQKLNEFKKMYGVEAARQMAAQLGVDLPIADDSSSTTDYDWKEYLEGLFSSQGAENEINRQFNSAEAALNRSFQAKESQLQRDWYESMSNSAYQRSVADMKAAGINPILAYSQGGAAVSGTGIGAGSAAAYTATGGDSLSSVLSAAADVVNSLVGASSSKISTAFKIFRMMGG